MSTCAFIVQSYVYLVIFIGVAMLTIDFEIAKVLKFQLHNFRKGWGRVRSLCNNS